MDWTAKGLQKSSVKTSVIEVQSKLLCTVRRMPIIRGMRIMRGMRTVRGMAVPAKATSRVQVPPTYARSPLVVSAVSWKGRRPNTRTLPFSGEIRCFPRQAQVVQLFSGEIRTFPRQASRIIVLRGDQVLS